MAQVERSTSTGGKRYLTSKAVVYDSVTAKNIQLGGKNNGNGQLKLYDDTDTLFVNMDKEGITLSNGAEIIGGSGLKNSMFVQGVARSLKFIINNDFAPVGIDVLYITDNGGVNWTGNYVKGSMLFEFYIPSTFTITNATITLTHIAQKNYAAGVFTYTGYSRNLQLYKGAAFTNMFKTYDSTFGTLSETGITYTVITNALGASGFTGSATAMSSVTSIDITSNISLGTNIFKIETGDNVPSVTGTYDQCVEAAEIRTGACIGLLTITGFTQ